MATPQPLVVLLTDFGQDSWYVGAMKGALLAVNPALTLVDLCHSVPGHRIGDGSFILLSTYTTFPPGSVFLAVVDPTVGSDRKGLAARAGDRFFVAPDNGLLTEVLQREPDHELRYLENTALWRERPRPTFHGRDIFAPVAAHLASGQPLAEFGSPCTQPVELMLHEPIWDGEHLAGNVVLVDSFGNLITDISEERLEKYRRERAVGDEELEVVVSGHRLRGLKRTYHDALPGEALALVGSSGYLEVAINRGSAARRLDVGAGAAVILGHRRGSGA
jgi:S-adenosylmethionine hydrolase